ncbi:FecR domain-containing protein [Pseudodonghicola sp.]|uniref:FecR domain-containing protein n=1 Tax=Pseudodonghicola sp. TaxID=1969463 RepID=UPI003A984F62
MVRSVVFAIPVRAAIAAVVGCLALTVSSAGIAAEVDPMDAPLEHVRLDEADTLRGIVEKYLHDPDLWPVVLALNNIASPADLRPGTDLALPVRQVLAVDHALQAALQDIQRASAEGARIFAPIEIGRALEAREAALSQRQRGDWRQVISYAGEASDFARRALEISIAQRDRAAEAVVSDVQGRVEGRSPAEPAWTNRLASDVLVEFERLRTLSNSSTQITFRDLSRLRLNQNSNATIQRMRSDPLTGGEVTKVSLAEGDFYALLNQLSDRVSFKIEVPGAETTTRSSDFWIKQDESGARFVNYDSPDLEIAHGAETITLGENEGVVLTAAGSRRALVLDSPQPMVPAPGSILYGSDAPLAWQKLDGARAYWLEIAADPGFNQLMLSEWGIKAQGFAVKGLAPGQYHWRIAALDALGLPGAWSAPRDFTLRVDITPPFLALLSPAEGSILTAPEVEVLGASELSAQIALNGAPLALGADGSFLARLALDPGENRIELAARDPAGNESHRSLMVIYRPVAAVQITLSDTIPRVDGALVSRTDGLTVTAATSAIPGTEAVVRDAAGAEVLRTRIDAAGRLSFTVPVTETRRRFGIEILGPGDAVEGRLEFLALSDRLAPEIALDLPPPRVTGEAELPLAGMAGDAVALELNGEEVALTAGRFDLTHRLVPGENGLELTARDAVGNVSRTRFDVFFDIEPPELSRIELGRPQGDSGPIELTVMARDPGGLRQAAAFTLSVGGEEVRGFLRCDNATGVCRASLPPRPGKLRLIELAVEDYAGNTAIK